VEIVGVFTQQVLKSSLGSDDWLRFFALMSAAIARREGTPPVPGTPDDEKALTKELRRHASKLRVEKTLEAYGAALQVTEPEVEGHTFLLELDTAHNRLSISTFDNALEATERYGAIERAIEGEATRDVVLVQAESLLAYAAHIPTTSQIRPCF
jgi:hypothetical protein